MSTTGFDQRVVSGMRPTGRLTIANYHGALKNWVALQPEYDCFFFVADWHALTTGYQDTSRVDRLAFEMVVDWIGAGINPEMSTVFIQSKVPEHAELHLLLSMTTPRSWLERVPSYKEQIQQLNDRELDTYGFLGYGNLMATDILIYRAGKVPVGADQIPHVELTREIARRFNYVYGKEDDFEKHAKQALKKIPKRSASVYSEIRIAYVQNGDSESLERGRALIEEQANLSVLDRERLLGYLEGGFRPILPEPEVLLTKTPSVVGLDGRKMHKSYGNAIQMREDDAIVDDRIRRMTTDPNRVRRKDPGNPSKCPVFELHQMYSTEEVCNWAAHGCRTAGIGCLDCKKPLIDSVIAEQREFRHRAAPYAENPGLVKRMLLEGSERARVIARDTLEDVRSAIGISYR